MKKILYRYALCLLSLFAITNIALQASDRGDTIMKNFIDSINKKMIDKMTDEEAKEAYDYMYNFSRAFYFNLKSNKIMTKYISYDNHREPASSIENGLLLMEDSYYHFKYEELENGYKFNSYVIPTTDGDIDIRSRINRAALVFYNNGKITYSASPPGRVSTYDKSISTWTPAGDDIQLNVETIVAHMKAILTPWLRISGYDEPRKVASESMPTSFITKELLQYAIKYAEISKKIYAFKTQYNIK